MKTQKRKSKHKSIGLTQISHSKSQVCKSHKVHNVHSLNTGPQNAAPGLPFRINSTASAETQFMEHVHYVSKWPKGLMLGKTVSHGLTMI